MSSLGTRGAKWARGPSVSGSVGFSGSGLCVPVCLPGAPASAALGAAAAVGGAVGGAAAGGVASLPRGRIDARTWLYNASLQLKIDFFCCDLPEQRGETPGLGHSGHVCPQPA